MRRLFPVLMFIVFCCAGKAHAAFIDGTYLANMLNAYDRYMNSRGTAQDAADGSFATGYILGVVDAKAKTLACIPDGIKSDQFFAIVKKYLEERPQVWNLSGDFLITSSLSLAFPCKVK